MGAGPPERAGSLETPPAASLSNAPRFAEEWPVVETWGIRAGRRGLIVMGAVLVTTCLALPANAAFETAPRSAMGDVILVREGGGGGTNVAFRAVPVPADRPRLVPLPLGLAQLAAQPPVFDIESPDFSALALADRLILNPPDDLQLTSLPTGEDATIGIHLAEDEIRLDFGPARDLVPLKAVENGGRFAADLVTTRVGGVDFGVTPLVIETSAVALSPDLTAALRDGVPLASTGVYTLDTEIEALAALALGVTYARQIAGPVIVAEPGLPFPEPPGFRVYAGGGAKLLLGGAYFASTIRAAVVPEAPLLDPDDPTSVEVAGELLTSVPQSFGTAGQGLSFDLGLAAVHGEAWEMGLGATDVAGWIRWRANRDEIRADADGDLAAVRVASAESHTSRLTPQIALNAARHFDRRRLTLAADVRRGVDGTTCHLGAERLIGRYALRGGALLDQGGRLQASAGGGVRIGRLGIDSALYTRSVNLVGDRALMLGLSFAIH